MVGQPASFPALQYESPEEYFADYQAQIAFAWTTIDRRSIVRAVNLLRECLDRDHTIYACGNGGSAAIANHLLCDFVKGVQTGTNARPRVVSLSSHLELLSAIANDIGYEDVFVYQLRTLARPGDILVTISSSGNSENIVRAMTWAKINKISTIALAGFDGGRSTEIAEVSIHVHSHNYGIVEDVHQSLMHVLSQFLRQSMMQAHNVGECTF